MSDNIGLTTMPPTGKRWHRNDFTDLDIPKGYRPLLHGEHPQRGDECEDAPHMTTGERWYKHFTTEHWVASQHTRKVRTQRPIL